MAKKQVEVAVRGAKPSIWVIEGRWGDSRDKSSVVPTMRSFQEIGVATVHVPGWEETPEGLAEVLKRWAASQAEFCYLALHGAPGAVGVRGAEVSLEDVMDAIAAGSGREGNEGKTLHVGSCSSLRHSGSVAERDRWVSGLRRRAGLRVLSGHQNDVEWFDAMAFEILLFQALANYANAGSAYEHLKGRVGLLMAHLGVVMATSSRVYRPA